MTDKQKINLVERFFQEAYEYGETCAKLPPHKTDSALEDDFTSSQDRLRSYAKGLLTELLGREPTRAEVAGALRLEEAS